MPKKDNQNQKFSIYLFNQENPRGQMFNLTEKEIEQHEKDGWLDSPASLELPEPDAPELSEEQIKNSRPEDLVELVRSYGFIVMTPEQLTAEANKMASVALDITKFSDEAFIAEAERRGLKQSDAIVEELKALTDRFNHDPKELNKDELVTLGNNGYTLGLRSNMKEDTLIEKISAALKA